MTNRKDLPEEATEEPRTLTPAEDTERAWQRFEEASRSDAPNAPDAEDRNSPLRMPGEPSSPPPDIPSERR